MMMKSINVSQNMYGAVTYLSYIPPNSFPDQLFMKNEMKTDSFKTGHTVLLPIITLPLLLVLKS